MEKNQQDYLVGQVLGDRFKVLKRIGRGGMANVYQGIDLQKNIVVALKVLKREYLSDAEFVKRFDAEAIAASSLSHPNIVKVYGVGTDQKNGERFMVMQFIEGTTLKEMIDTYGHLNWHLSLSLAIQVAQALQEAHLAGIVHRDIKPHNIMVTPTEQALVTDFGIARANRTNMITMAGAVALGSVHYFSPEQARGSIVGFKADIYSLGIVLYEMLTGQLPFDGDTSVAVAIMQLQNEAVPPHQINPHIPLGLSQIVMKCMRKNPLERYEDAEALINELVAFRNNPAKEYGKVIPVEEKSRNTAVLPHANYLEITNFDKVRHLEKSVYERQKKRRREWLLISFLTFIIIFVFLFIGNQLLNSFIKEQEIQEENSFVIENYVDRKLKEVIEELDKNEIKYNIIKKATDDQHIDLILEQNIPANTKLNSIGRKTLILTVGTSREIIQVPPSLVGKKMTEISTILDALDIRYKVQYEISENQEKDYIFKTEPPEGADLRKNQMLILYVSDGSIYRKVPDLTGLSREEAKRILEENDLVFGDVTLIGFLAEQGTHVLRTDPEAGTEVKRKTKIRMIMEDRSSSSGSDFGEGRDKDGYAEHS